VIIIQHRVNDINLLQQTPKHLGVEIDIRSDQNELYLSHDPYEEGPLFTEFLDHFDHSFIVLNLKEEGLENRCVELLRSKGIEDYFFLDQSMPFLIRRGLAGQKDGACRISEYESLSTVNNLLPFCNWVWVDSFSSEGVSFETLTHLKSLGLKICLVSPELHGMDRQEEIQFLVSLTQGLSFQIDAVCTKFPEKWAQQ
jgi:hypothetical protein